MKKLLFIFIWLSIALLLITCSNETEVGKPTQNPDGIVLLTPEEFYCIAYLDSEEIEESDVLDIAYNFINELNAKEIESSPITKSFNSDFSLSLNSKSYFSNKTSGITTFNNQNQVTIPVYEVDVTSGQENGKVYVSADARYPEVISFIPKISDDENLFWDSGAAFLVEWSKASIYEKVIKVESAKDRAMTKISTSLGIDKEKIKLSEIIDRIDIDYTKATPEEMSDFISDSSHLISKLILPLVPVQWNQGPPYNNLLQSIPSPPNYYPNVYTGCAVTSALQIMAALKPITIIDGMNINWNYLTENKHIYINDEQDRLDMLYKITDWAFKKLHATPLFDSSTGLHIGTFVFNVAVNNLYSAYFTYNYYGGYSVNHILTSLDNAKPVQILGDNHAFILDGYLKKTLTSAIIKDIDPMETAPVITPQIIYINYYLHANLGWGGHYDGYYKIDTNAHVNFECGSYIFNSDHCVVYTGLTRNAAILSHQQF